MSINDLPKRSPSHDTEETAEAAFVAAIESCAYFVNQGSDRHDYGTDIQIEARSGEAMTNVRVHVQLKGTNSQLNKDESVSVSVQRTNLNYLLPQTDSIYVCYHLPTERLLVCFADDVHRKYSHRNDGWEGQDTITINLREQFDEEFQRRLNKRVIASNNSSKDQRLSWAVTPPKKIHALLNNIASTIHVPANPELAREILFELYNAGEDAAISGSFEQFAAVLERSRSAINLAYMAEINLGINGVPFDQSRVRQGIEVLHDSMRTGKAHPGSTLYCIGNAWLALGEHEKAQIAYRAALLELNSSKLKEIAAQCYKNLGSALENFVDAKEIRDLYVKALELDPELGEAHFALALWYRREGSNLSLALKHLDRILPRGGNALTMTPVQGWRINLLFRVGSVAEAFREIKILLGDWRRYDWIWPWCAREVLEFGKLSIEATQHAAQFWQAYMRVHPNHSAAQREQLMCQWRLRAAGESTEIDFEAFKGRVRQLLNDEDPDTAFFWDRIGRWAQHDGNWEQAEDAYRKAFSLEPELYGYCLAAALNHLDRYEEALPILLDQALNHLPDAMSWFQVAFAREHTGDIEGSISAYHQAVELDSNYDLAWFNLGGVYWNSNKYSEALEVWCEAVSRFPNHRLTTKLYQDFPLIFESNSTNSDE